MSDVASIGHNLPPEPRLSLKDQVIRDNKELFDRAPELIKALESTPPVIADDVTAAAVADNLSSAKKWLKKMDGTKKAETDDLNQQVKEIRTTFVKAAEPVEKLVDSVHERQEAYSQKKKDESARILEEKAKAAREEAEKKAAEAKAAQEAKEKAEREEREAREREEAAKRRREDEERKAAQAKAAKEAAEKAEREAIERRHEQERRDREDCDVKLVVIKSNLDDAERQIKTLTGLPLSDVNFGIDDASILARIDVVQDALQFVRRRRDVLLSNPLEKLMRYEARLAEAQEGYAALLAAKAAADIAAKRKAREAEDAKREAERAERLRLQKEQDDRDQAEREARRVADEQAAAEARARKEAAEKEEREAKARMKAAKADEKSAVADQKDARAEQKDAHRDQRLAEDQGARADQTAGKIEKRLDGSPGDLARVRGDYGGIGTLARRWKVTVDSIAELDLEKLRHLINPDALQAAAWRYMQAGGRELRGATIEQVEEGRDL